MSIGNVFQDAQAAYDTAQAKNAVLAEARAQEASAVAAKQLELDAVKAEHAGYVSEAQAAADAAKAELVRLQEVLQDFMGRPDPRVSVK